MREKSSYGGAIYNGGEKVSFTFNGNTSLLFRNNKATALYNGSYSYFNYGGYGGAISLGRFSSDSTLTINGNTTVNFSDNAVSGFRDAFGGAIYGDWLQSFSMCNNGQVIFENNSALAQWHQAVGSNYEEKSQAQGGAIHLSVLDSPALINGNKKVIFKNNRTSVSKTTSQSATLLSYGGAIYAYSASLHMNGNGSVEFSGNVASSYGYGAAVYLDDSSLSICDNDSVIFRDNIIESRYNWHSHASAIQAYGAGYFKIQNNDYVLFENNNVAVCATKNYHTTNTDIIFSAPSGGIIEFRDNFYTDTTVPLSLNSNYVGDDGKSVRQTGDILFNSCSVWVEEAASHLYGGRLRIENGAVYQTKGLSAMVNSASTVILNRGALSSSGYDVCFSKGTALQLSGSNTISGNIKMESGSRLVFKPSSANDMSGEAKPLLNQASGSLVFQDGARIHIPLNSDAQDEQCYLLVSNQETQPDWVASWEKLLSLEADDCSCIYYNASAKAVYLYYDILKGTWMNYTGNRRWDKVSINWLDGSYEYVFSDGSIVTFGNVGAGAVTLVGTLKPHSVTVNNDSGYNY